MSTSAKIISSIEFGSGTALLLRQDPFGTVPSFPPAEGAGDGTNPVGKGSHPAVVAIIDIRFDETAVHSPDVFVDKLRERLPIIDGLIADAVTAYIKAHKSSS